MFEVWRRYIHTAVEAQLRDRHLKVSNLRHSNDTMAQLVRVLKTKRGRINHQHHTSSKKGKVLHTLIHSCNKTKMLRPVTEWREK